MYTAIVIIDACKIWSYLLSETHKNNIQSLQILLVCLHPIWIMSKCSKWVNKVYFLEKSRLWYLDIKRPF